LFVCAGETEVTINLHLAKSLIELHKFSESIVKLLDHNIPSRRSPMTRQSWTNLGTIACLIALTAGSATAQSIPSELQVPNGQTLLSTVQAEGDQIYICQASSTNPEQFEWVLKAPEAVLLQNGKPIGKHYGGPTWESNDGSKIVGQVKNKVNAPQADAIPWLLLEVKSNQGNGSLSEVNWVQRIRTSGGKAPTTGCDRSTSNTTVRVGYSADYLFYSDTSKHGNNQPNPDDC
jgi:hypothetical protein